MSWRSLIVPCRVGRPYGRKSARALREMVEDWSVDIPDRSFPRDEWRALDTAMRYLRRPEAMDGSEGVPFGPERPNGLPTGFVSRRDIAERLFDIVPGQLTHFNGVPLERAPCGTASDPRFRVWQFGHGWEPVLLDAWKTADVVINGIDTLVVPPRKKHCGACGQAKPDRWAGAFTWCPPCALSVCLDCHNDHSATHADYWARLAADIDESPHVGHVHCRTPWHSLSDNDLSRALSGPLTAEQIVREIRATTTRIADWAAPQKETP